jgi:hypothetical protein
MVFNCSYDTFESVDILLWIHRGSLAKIAGMFNGHVIILFGLPSFESIPFVRITARFDDRVEVSPPRGSKTVLRLGMKSVIIIIIVVVSMVDNRRLADHVVR